MKAFRFTLQALRVLREQKEQLAQKRYAAALLACEAAAARVQAASEELTGCWHALSQKLSAGVAATELLRSHAWCNVLELRLKERAAALEQARLAVDTVWHEMILATRERETLDRFYDKKRLAYDRESQRVEQKNLDELAVQLAGVSPLTLQNA